VPQHVRRCLWASLLRWSRSITDFNLHIYLFTYLHIYVMQLFTYVCNAITRWRWENDAYVIASHLCQKNRRIENSGAKIKIRIKSNVRKERTFKRIKETFMCLYFINLIFASYWKFHLCFCLISSIRFSIRLLNS